MTILTLESATQASPPPAKLMSPPAEAPALPVGNLSGTVPLNKEEDSDDDQG